MPRIKANRSAPATDDVQAVVLALRIIEHIAAESDAAGVTAIADALGSTKSRIHRHLRTLVRQGYLEQTGESEKYRVGERLLFLGRSLNARFDLATVAGEAMRELRDALGHSTVISQPESDGMRVLATISGNSMMEIGVKRGSLLGFHHSAQGKLALAFGPPSLLQRVLRSRLAMRSPKTITNPRALQREVDRIRRQGWAVAPGESALGINTLAAPIFAADGALAGTLAIVDSIQYIGDPAAETQVRAVVRTARRISALLGHAAAATPRAAVLADA